MSGATDARFQTEAGERLAARPGVQAVTLGGLTAEPAALPSAVDQAGALLAGR